jgi:hypothetical protein
MKLAVVYSVILKETGIIPPEMRYIITKAKFEVILSSNNRKSGVRSDDITHSILISDSIISRPGGDDISAFEISAPEFVQHERLKRMPNRIDIIYSSKPRYHPWSAEALRIRYKYSTRG